MPHRVAFVADPQLVDPHTYPDRPWPLSVLTVKYTDQYLRRSFSSMQQRLGPDSVLFLGDLFDGGREWATESTSSPEERYKKYQDSFWKQEYERFSKVFTLQFHEGDALSENPLGRRMIASLPGNHDLGFGSGIQVPVRERFQTFFGKGNRVDVLGNHTFVQVDTVSLSAMDQPDPETGSTGAGSGDGTQPNKQIWKEAEEFLNGMESRRAIAETRELHSLQNKRDGSDGYKFQHAAVGVDHPSIENRPNPQLIGLPSILLTHVPLYRKPATPCGPHRERYPPSSTTEELEEDEPNALKISGGYQYQNVLTQTISNSLVSKIGPNLVHVYSGDDHDYCEIAHREFSGSPREITVKSFSWAMGVRRPGFVLASLWNPIDTGTGKSLLDGSSSISSTVQNHLCLLPDQLAVFIRYGLLLGATLVVLLVRAVVVVISPPPPSERPILPLSEDRQSSSDPSPSHDPRSSSMSSSALLSISPHGLASRATNAPRSNYIDHPDKDLSLKGPGNSKNAPSSSSSFERRRPRTKRGTWRAVAAEFWDQMQGVAKVVLLWYGVLIWWW